MKRFGSIYILLTCVFFRLPAQNHEVQLPDSIVVSADRARYVLGWLTEGVPVGEVAEAAEDFLFDAYSPTVDEEAFIVVADSLLKDSRLSESVRLRLEVARESAMLNRVGETAADFEIIMRDGTGGCLSEMLKRHHVNILMFYDPDCHDCAELEHFLSECSLDGVGVVMVSPYGEQDGLWAEHAATMPADWIVARPESDDFDKAGLYDIRITPTVYLLDAEANVLAKNLRRDTILSFLDSIR